jgi:hypothetical protein
MSVNAMSAPPLLVERPDFLATAECGDRTVSVRMSGTADLDVKKALDEFLVRLHETARTTGAIEVVMDVRELKFMNSSCLKGLVTWIGTVQGLPIMNQYRIVLTSRADLHWQRRSLHALSSLAAGLVTVRSS